ncbi:MAG: DNA polymerase [Gammaproteobacteria bacterium]|nr:DNA polymerase [Gammaproteobacteria bacterium]
MSLRSFFVDFNSYFASVEQQLRPELRGLPVGVVPVMAETTCCIAASYEAKAYGIKTGTQVAEARRLCPDIRIVQARPPVYVDFHHRLVDAVWQCLPVDRVLSIDEMIGTLGRSQQQRDVAIELAHQVKQTIYDAVGSEMRCSIGIAPNFFLAKTASKMQKPDGCVVIEDHDLPQCLYALELGDLYGIGRRMLGRLNKQQIYTVEDLCNADKQTLRVVWNGIEGERMYARLRGEHVYTPPTKQGSIGHSHVLSPDNRSPDAAFAILQKLLQKAANRLRHGGLVSGRLQLRVDYLNDQTWRDKLRFDPTDDTLALLHGLKQMWQRRPMDMPALLRVSVVLTNLFAKQAHSLSLFDEPRIREQLNGAIDSINNRFGRNSVYFAGAHRAMDSAPMRIAFTHIPDPSVEGDN